MKFTKPKLTCNACGNVVEVKQAGAGDLVCCGQSMELLSDEEAAKYKSVAA